MAFDLVFDLELGIGTDLRWDLREGGILHVYGGVARFYLFFLKSSSYVSRKKKNERMEKNYTTSIPGKKNNGKGCI